MRREPGGGIARVGVEAEVCRAGGLPYHEHIQLALVRVVGWMSFKGEIARGFRISGCGSGSLYGQFYVVEYIQGVEIIFCRKFFARQQYEADGAQNNSGKRDAPGTVHESAGQLEVFACGNGGQNKQRNINERNEYDYGQEIV